MQLLSKLCILNCTYDQNGEECCRVGEVNKYYCSMIDAKEREEGEDEDGMEGVR